MQCLEAMLVRGIVLNWILLKISGKYISQYIEFTVKNIAIYRNSFFLHRDTPSVWGAPKIFFLVIFIQNGAIFGNANGYMCLDIMSQKESRLPIFEFRCTVYSVNSLIIVCVGIQSMIRVHHCLRT